MTSGIGQYVVSPPRYIRIDNLPGGVGGDCDGKIINLAELTLLKNGAALDMSGTPVVMSTFISEYGSPEKLVDGNSANFIHTRHLPTCDQNPWMYIDVTNRIFV